MKQKNKKSVQNMNASDKSKQRNSCKATTRLMIAVLRSGFNIKI